MKKKWMGKLLSLMSASLLALSAVACGDVTGGVSGNTVSVSNGGGVLVDHDTAAATTLFTVEDIDITLEDFYLFMVQYIYTYSVGPEKIATPESIQSAYSSIIDEIKLETVEYKLALVEELEPDPVNLSDAKTKADSFYNYFGEDFFNTYGISKEKVEELFERQVYIDTLKQYTLDQLADDYETEYIDKYGEMQCFTVYYVLFPGIKYDENGQPVSNGNGGYEVLSDDEMAAQLVLAEELRGKALDNILNGEGDGNLEELAIEYGIDNVSGIQRGYYGEYQDELNDIISNMENGDISEIITTDAGYMIVRMDNNDDTEFRDFSIRYMAEQSATSLYPTVQENWMKSSGVADLQPDSTLMQNLQIMAMSTYLTTNGLTMDGGVN